MNLLCTKIISRALLYFTTIMDQELQELL